MTSNAAGLSVPDWPNSYGHFMFAFPFGQMVGGILYEHGHRMIASTVGVMMVVLAIWVARREERRWVRRLAWAALAMVVAQGVLGGITVLFFLPTIVSTGHALLAQTFFCLTIALAYATSREGRRERSRVRDNGRVSLARLTGVAVGVIVVQLLLGAWMRHSNAGGAIPDVPLVYGSLLPPVTGAQLAAVNAERMHRLMDPVTYAQLWIHYAHRLWALVVTAVLGAIVLRVRRTFRGVPALARPVLTLALLLFAQLTLGVLTVLTAINPLVTTAHVAVGAAVLGTTFLLAIRAARSTVVDVAVPGVAMLRGIMT